APHASRRKEENSANPGGATAARTFRLLDPIVPVWPEPGGAMNNHVLFDEFRLSFHVPTDLDDAACEAIQTIFPTRPFPSHDPPHPPPRPPARRTTYPPAPGSTPSRGPHPRLTNPKLPGRGKQPGTPPARVLCTRRERVADRRLTVLAGHASGVASVVMSAL